MRADMAKVIVERPRIGSRTPSRKKGYKRSLQRIGFDNLPLREPMLGLFRGGDKWLNEHLGPMRRFLRSRVGKPWNKVHQELCEHVSFDNSVQKHVLSHIHDFVARNVEIVGDQVFGRHRYGRRQLRAGDMYICPRTGLLKLVRASRRRRPPRLIGRGRLTQFHFREGAWWEVRLRPLAEPKLVTRRHAGRRPETSQFRLWDVWLERYVMPDEKETLTNLYGNALAAVSKRLLAPAEVEELHRDLRRKRSKDGRG